MVLIFVKSGVFPENLEKKAHFWTYSPENSRFLGNKYHFWPYSSSGGQPPVCTCRWTPP